MSEVPAGAVRQTLAPIAPDTGRRYHRLMRPLLLAAFVATGVSGVATPSAVRACGGRVVTTHAGTVGANAKRIFLSVRGGNTDVITQVGVPATTADYGVLIPVPAEPTLDPMPVSMNDLASLERLTAPAILIASA